MNYDNKHKRTTASKTHRKKIANAVKTNNNDNKSNKIKSGKKKKKRSIRKIILISLLVIILLVVITAGVLVGIFFGMFGDELKIDKKDLIVGATNSKIVDKNGDMIAVIAGNEKRQVIALDEMAEYLPKAYVAIEDERFYEHHGVDIKRTAGAIINYVFHKGKSGFGGSSITQQLIKNITQEDEQSGMAGILRKVKEWARAYNVEKMLSKDQILELYLNILFVGGNNLHGVELGAKYYFDKSSRDLSLAECAFMAGINSSPNSYNAFSDNEDMINKIKNKTKVVLNKMKETGAIKSEEDYTNAIAEVDAGLPFKRGTVTTSNLSYHAEAALNEVIEDYMKEKGCTKDLAEVYIYSSGLTIHTTQDTAIQKRMEEEYTGNRWIFNSRKYQGETTQSAMVIIDQKTGYVVGTVGGLGEKTPFGFNRATQSTRQTGSSMKPLAAIAPGLENGIITAGKVYDDVPTSFGGYTPKNYYGGFKGLSTVRYVIEISQNIIPMKILSEIGIRNSIDFLEGIGITSLVKKEQNEENNDESLSLAIGGLTYGISPLQMAGAYAMIANDGVYIEPTFYTKVTDKEGNVVLESKQESKRAMSEANAYVLKSILTQPVISGTATVCKIPGMDVCAKTGTTDNEYDRWLCGFTPYYTAAVWYGFDKNEDIPYEVAQEKNPCSFIFKSIMGDIHKDLPNAKFEEPKNIVRVAICRDSGLLATEDCKDTINGNRVYTEVYVAGTQPKETCKTHVRAKVCEIEEGKFALSNEWCPDSRELVFITRPNSENDKSWERADDAKFMLPTEKCTLHEEVKEPEPIVVEQSPSNIIDPNSIWGNLIGGNTTKPENTIGENTTNTTNSIDTPTVEEPDNPGDNNSNTTNNTNTNTNSNTNTNTNTNESNENSHTIKPNTTKPKGNE